MHSEYVPKQFCYKTAIANCDK